MIEFTAKLLRPAGPEKAEGWLFLKLPNEASRQLPSRGLVTVEGTMEDIPILVTVEPDGQGGHWLKVDSNQRQQMQPGDHVHLKVQPVTLEPEPRVPQDIRDAIDSSSQLARETWEAITPIARRDWIHWITSGKKSETRTKRLQVALDKLSRGSRRPCCFDRSGMYSKSLSCPIEEERL